MVKNVSKLKKMEDDYTRRTKPDLNKNFKLLDALYEEARALSVFPLKDPLEGLDVDIRIAKAINSVPKTP
ncbi:MAG: hypothetical protein JXB26_16975 [Candidatus Aminicenantes bacterium]|nr:hypothetical protein [Candidatus Aminicenantes bacterium]